MSRILLVDDSPHAQRMGERILTDEGYEVVTVSNADSALVRMEDVDPDLVLADTVMPGRTGFEICQYLKMSPRHRHVRVILTAGVLEPLDEAHTQRVEADGVLKKPFEATALLSAVKPLAEAAVKDREAMAAAGPAGQARRSASGPVAGAAGPVAPFIALVDSEQVRAAVTVALDAAMGTMVDEITHRVLAALNRTEKTDSRRTEIPPVAAPAPASDAPAAPAREPDGVIAAEQPLSGAPAGSEPGPVSERPQAMRVEPVRRVTPLRQRTGSILGIEVNRPDSPEDPPANSHPPSDSH
jgi:CheY-like chemotaxis protein